MAHAIPDLDVKAVTKCFNLFTAMDLVSFSVQAGKVTGYLGLNNNSRFTIRTSCGLLSPTIGTVESTLEDGFTLLAHRGNASLPDK